MKTRQESCWGVLTNERAMVMKNMTRSRAETMAPTMWGSGVVRKRMEQVCTVGRCRTHESA